jgi:hypothetical protein
LVVHELTSWLPAFGSDIVCVTMATQQDDARHKAFHAPVREGRMRGVALMLMVALLFIAGVVAREMRPAQNPPH